MADSKPNTQGNRPTVRRSFTRRVVRFLLRGGYHMLAMIGLVSILWPHLAGYSVIVSGSMKPTLCGEDFETGDRYVYERVTYRLRQPQRWELIVFRNESGDLVVKRVVGLPGEKIAISRLGEVYIDYNKIERPQWMSFIRYYRYGNLMRDQAPYQCTEGYYVLGDDSRDSDDSRFIGQVMPDEILGRPWFITWPEEHRGWIR